MAPIARPYPALLVGQLLLAVLVAAPLPAQTGDPARDLALDQLLQAAGCAESEARGRALFEEVLAQPAFEHAAVGLFDLYVYKAGLLAKAKAGRKKLDEAAEGLERAAQLFARLPERADGLVSGQRFPILLAPDLQAYEQLVALLDRCEDEGLSGWKPVNAVWTHANRGAEVTRTWEAQVLNLAHGAIASQGKDWMEHGLGYYAIAHLANRLLRQGAWGNVPPWLAQGLIDELDIEAHGEAWVGSSEYRTETAGWSRPGWSGFVPEGASPPPPVTGPPADLAVTVRKTGNGWDDREASALRHWADLVADRKSAAPASFAFMARNESFFPRDRAYARCVLSLVLDEPAGEPGLLASLDRRTTTPPSGMPDGDPLPLVFARALDGPLPELDAFEALSLQAMLAELGRDELADRLRALGAGGLLALSDHRDQAAWLYGRMEFTPEARTRIFHLILEAEYWQQLREWELIGVRLDAAAEAALQASSRYPRSAAERARVMAAFRAGLGSP